MKLKFRNTLTAGVLAALGLAPGVLPAQETQPPAQERMQQQQTAPTPTTEPMMRQGTKNDASLASVANLTPKELEGMDVVDSANESVGSVDKVVRSRQDGLIYAVVESGGVLGIGAKDIPVPLQDMEKNARNLQVSVQKQALRNWPEYDEDQFVELEPSDRPISEFAAFETTPAPEQGKQSPANQPAKSGNTED